MLDPNSDPDRTSPARDRDRPPGVLRWAVVGTSSFALDWVARAIVDSDRNKLAAIVSRDEARAMDAAERLGATQGTTSLEDAMGAGVDAVYICTPNSLHTELTLEALGLGCHVLVEKPMATTSAECASMIREAADRGLTLGVGHCMAWAPPIVAAGQVLASGELGDPVIAAVSCGFDYPPQGLWRQEDSSEAGGGPLFDLGAHAVDALLSLFGPATRVGASLLRTRYSYDAEDTASLFLEFQRGVSATIQVSFAANMNSLNVECSAGRLSSSEWLGREFAGELTVSARSAGVGTFPRNRNAPEERKLQLPVTNVVRSEIDEFSSAILDGATTRIDAFRGMRTVQVLEGAIRSSREGVILRLGASQ